MKSKYPVLMVHDDAEQQSRNTLPELNDCNGRGSVYLKLRNEYVAAREMVIKEIESGFGGNSKHLSDKVVFLRKESEAFLNDVDTYHNKSRELSGSLADIGEKTCKLLNLATAEMNFLGEAATKINSSLELSGMDPDKVKIAEHYMEKAIDDHVTAGKEAVETLLDISFANSSKNKLYGDGIERRRNGEKYKSYPSH